VFEQYGADLEGETATYFHSSNKIEEVSLLKMRMVKKGMGI